MAEEDSRRTIAHAAVEGAIRALIGTRLKTQSDAMLRTFLAFKAVHRDGVRDDVGNAVVKAAVEELFTLLPTPEGVDDSKYNGTIALRGSKGGPVWLRNDSYRGAFIDYAGPNSPGRLMFQDENWHKPLVADAVDRVTETLGGSGYAWPPREALTSIVLRNDVLDPASDWDQLGELACNKLGLTEDEWSSITSADALGLDPFDGDPWDPTALSRQLRPPGAEHAKQLEQQIDELPKQVRSQVERVLDALRKHGQRSIIALAGVPGTSKSYVARIAARTYASEGCLREIQFSPSYTYEEFIEGPRYGKEMEVQVIPGAFLELNQRAVEDPSQQYVFLIEELTRADLPRVLGELLTYVEYRGQEDQFTTMYRREETTRIAPNVAILATYNPTDRSAINIDAALIRRLRILDFPPNMELLREMLTENGVDGAVVEQLISMFEACREITGPDRFDSEMPFGHAMFAAVQKESDLFYLWHEGLKRILVRPHAPQNELYPTILANYPWQEAPDVTVVAQPANDSGQPEDESGT